ncbi:monosaccharide ABC transporter membrane protein (CUT2 family) [Halanaerobium saccharolyticum]|jgi:ribose transport system permease protein|uniref:Monosaccharide ABC transporter membrane protein (CUT2 family) n=1 Tax=Halanaerobium saccharolyticum TaxID=43595 RepID=A0A2T5RLM5_9FIRM|nr:ABC transporter permease [Halanaerobium saccharolyticum]PTW00157.1 monosaccharide ABC transporter membrane protein (CUT2 family) [Halanaerobium saccharolyticum]TDP93582.1 monosaccharide ABC transporter membrane protein (CUT2 family) [Halanaerobium saccharolyticum]
MQKNNKQNSEQGFKHWFIKKWSTEPIFSTGIALIVMIILQTWSLGFDYDSFGSWFFTWTNNWINILRNNAGVGLIALGMSFVIMSAGIDLSVGSTMVAVGAALMMLIDRGPNGILINLGIEGIPAILIAILVSLAFGYFLGNLNGILITRGGIPPFVVTLATMKLYRSVTQHFMQGYNPRVPLEFLPISNFQIGRFRMMPIIYWLLIAAVLYFMSKRTTFGRQIIAVGSNERSANLSGVNVKKVKRRVYAITGLLVSFAAIIQVSRIGSMDYANAGSGYEMEAIAAAVVGGTSMSGGRGTVIGTLLGVLIIAVMNNLLNLLGVPPFLREAFKGLILIGAVLMQKKQKTV